MTSQQEKHVLSVLYFNVCSLLPKIDNLRLICAVFKPGIVCVVESWLNNSIQDVEISIQGCQIVRLDHTRHGGGLVIYVNNLLTCSVLYRGSPDFEFIMLCLTANVFNPNFYFNLVNACIIGDFNTDFLSPQTFCTINFSQLCPLLTSPKS